MHRAFSQSCLIGWVALSLCGCSNPATLIERSLKNDEAASGRAGYIQTRFGGFDPTTDGLPNLLKSQSHSPDGTPTALWAMPFAGRASGPSYIVQFSAPLGRAERALVSAVGGHIRGYIPENALLVDATSEQADTLRRGLGVRAVIPAPSLLKVDPRLVRPRGASMTLDAPLTQQEAVVEVTEPQALEAVHAALQEAGGERLDDLTTPYGNGATSMHVRLGAEALLRLATLPEVAGISPKFARLLHNDKAAGLVQSGAVGRPKMWDAGIRGEGQVVAFADTGLHVNSCYFSAPGKVLAYQDWAGANEGDQDGHGTHVAGSIAGNNGAKLAFRRYDGMAPAASLVVQDMAAGSSLVGLNRDLTPILQGALDAGAFIHSNSWGDDDNTYGPDARAIDRFVRTHPHFLVVVANGNAGARGHSSVGSPATAKNIIAVGATDASAPERAAGFSSRGPTLDGRIKPTLVAPGVNVNSAMHRGQCRSETRSGTSMATPILAGAAALARQYFVEGYYPSGHKRESDALIPTAALLRSVLVAGADSMRAEKDIDEAVTQNGFGRLHLDRVLRFGEGPHKLFVVNEEHALHTGESMTFSFTLAAGMPLDVALAWTDPPASPGAGWALVNDLDLFVAKDGVTMLGNGALVGDDGAYAAPDALNVEEVVHLPMAPGGRYTVTVSAPLVPLGPQSFALTLAGAIEGSVVSRLGSNNG